MKDTGKRPAGKRVCRQAVASSGSGTRSVRNTESGASLTELALMVPFGLVLLLGAVDFGRVQYEATVVASAAMAGAKFGAHDSGRSYDIAGMEEAARADLRESLDEDATAVAAARYCICPDGIEVPCSTGSCTAGPNTRRAYVRVRVDKPFATLFPYPGVPETILLSRETQIRVQ